MRSEILFQITFQITFRVADICKKNLRTESFLRSFNVALYLNGEDCTLNVHIL